MTYIHLLSFASFSILLQQVPSLSQLCHSHGLALALATLFRYTGPRVSEVAAFQIPDVQVGARHGLRIIRRGKGLKHREIPLVQNRVNVHTQYSKISVSRRIGHEYPIGVMCRVLEGEVEELFSMMAQTAVCSFAPKRASLRPTSKKLSCTIAGRVESSSSTESA